MKRGNMIVLLSPVTAVHITQQMDVKTEKYRCQIHFSRIIHKFTQISQQRYFHHEKTTSH